MSIHSTLFIGTCSLSEQCRKGGPLSRLPLSSGLDELRSDNEAFGPDGRPVIGDGQANAVCDTMLFQFLTSDHKGFLLEDAIYGEMGIINFQKEMCCDVYRHSTSLTIVMISSRASPIADNNHMKSVKQEKTELVLLVCRNKSSSV